MIFQVLLYIAGLGILTSSGFLFLAIVATLRRRRKLASQRAPVTAYPPVSVLKPLCGLEANLEVNLTGFFRQKYDGPFEIIFATRDDKDPALDVVRQVSSRFPNIPVRIVYSGEPDRPNAKVCSLRQMCLAAAYEYLVMSDSDVYVEEDYLRKIVAPLLRPEVGLVTCVYRGEPTGGFWSKLEALGMSVEMTSGVVVADMLEGMTFALGPTMAIRKDVLQSIGGVDLLGDYYADDYVLGNEVYKSGKIVELSECTIGHTVYECSFSASLAHQVRWMRSTRFSRPLGHFSTALTFATPFGLLALLSALALHRPWLGVALFGWAAVGRMMLCLTAGWGVVHDRRALQRFWIYPLRDFMGFCFWCASYFSNYIIWRNGERYRFETGGKMYRVRQVA